ncbi:hypothetical protein PVAP13_3NG249827 [Panicum virgatum]|uniref:Uncharacterized protein n=1 Tax=Panicum virgatum TaxID=38727 RepID=A0A8T0U4S5_PANVG|nr:hypothetical protein PVAP13_3NG249827 [Panicum virgatum]KAG2616735.1 hypothetical protein PVAP13_3NG249827 [Panicum virgatum]
MKPVRRRSKRSGTAAASSGGGGVRALQLLVLAGHRATHAAQPSTAAHAAQLLCAQGSPGGASRLNAGSPAWCNQPTWWNWPTPGAAHGVGSFAGAHGQCTRGVSD